MGGKTIWDVSVFRYLLLRYPAIKVSVHIQVMRVDAASTTSMHTPTSRKNATGGDEGMTNGSPIFAYLVFGPGGVSFERFSRPTKASARRGPRAILGVQARLRGVQVGPVFVQVLFLNRSDLYLA
jgi:hypothetical protein